MSGWDLGGSSSGSKAEFTKFPVGLTRIRVLDDEPFTRWTHWIQKHKRSINCPGKGCSICEIRRQQKANKETQTYPMGRRIAINVYNYETERVEIMEQGVGFFEDLRDLMEDLHDEGKQLRDAVLKVRRRGQGKDDTSYRIDVDKIETMTEEEKAKMEDVVDLKEYFKPHTNEQVLRIVNGEEWDDVMKQETDDSVDDTQEESKEEEFEVK